MPVISTEQYKTIVMSGNRIVCLFIRFEDLLEIVPDKKD